MNRQTFKITYYYPVNIKDYEEVDMVDTPVKVGILKDHMSFPRKFVDRVRMEGSGILPGMELSYYGPTAIAPEQFEVLYGERFKWGIGCRSNILIPFVSVAADLSVLPFGTIATIYEFENLAMPDGNKHFGRIRSDDVGDKINGNHIDLFVRHNGDNQAMQKIAPSYSEVTLEWDAKL